jgi:hypothetical protein
MGETGMHKHTVIRVAVDGLVGLGSCLCVDWCKVGMSNYEQVE